jgi:hypothetical protein
MSYTIFGLYFMIQAILNALGSNIFLGKEYRDSKKGRLYQRKLVFPLTILGSGWIVMGTLHYGLYEGKEEISFYVWLGIITIVALIMMGYNKYKFKKVKQN